MSSHYFLFEVDDNVLDREYLAYFLRTRSFQDPVSAQGSTNYASIRPAQVLTYRIPLPPISEQGAIVARMRTLLNRLGQLHSVLEDLRADTDTAMEPAMTEVFAMS